MIRRETCGAPLLFQGYRPICRKFRRGRLGCIVWPRRPRHKSSDDILQAPLPTLYSGMVKLIESDTKLTIAYASTDSPRR
jgi:hypothetical protein